MDDPAALDALLDWRGRQLAGVELLDAVDSTNAEALRRSDRGERPDGRVLLARRQLAGHGSRGRPWDSPAGRALALTAWMAWPSERSPLLATWVGALAVVDAAAKFGVAATVKWPNDALARGRKFAGVLAELRAAAPGRSGTVALGIGLNVLQQASELPPAAATPATSLRLEGADVTLAAAGRALLEALDARLAAAFEQPQAVADAFAAALQLVARPVELSLAVGAPTATTLHGRLQGLAADGTVELGALADGTPGRRLHGGHVVALRAADPSPDR
ncbi:MAG: biotin--[acetyl-CoA-carboxylase] ligase [Planctomycetes bacterium]|nr:biotin--[acetyl-CoA-carboxylase] ligase [Planctomycetota bacterium]